MARYKLKAATFLQNTEGKVAGRHYPKGAVVDWDGPPSAVMEPLDDEARAKVDEVRATRRKVPSHMRCMAGPQWWER